MTLIRRLAGDLLGYVGEAAFLAGVIDLHPGPVAVVWGEHIVCKEVGIGAVRTHTEQTRVKAAGAA